jgi:hypothetical protein
MIKQIELQANNAWIKIVLFLERGLGLDLD